MEHSLRQVSGPPELTDMQRSTRDPERLRTRLEAWLAAKLDPDAEPVVTGLQGTSATGMSSDTILFTATWTEGGIRRDRELVARIAPDPADVPVFPSYDMHRQFEVIRLVGELTKVPVPRVRWSEPDPSVLGAAFFVMDRVNGRVPPDNLPYNFGDSWLFTASPDDRRSLQDASVALLAELHAVERPEERFAFMAFDEAGKTPLRRHVAHTRAWYDYVAEGGAPSPLVERAFAWLDDHWPAEERPAVLSWGDARIGNVLYQGFVPVAVLDWEMAGLGPRELDVSWIIHSHRAFEHLAQTFGLAGMPDFMRREDVVGTYTSLTGYQPRDLDFFELYDAIQWGIVFLRTGTRQVHFGERTMPDDVDDLILTRGLLEQLLDGARPD